MTAGVRCLLKINLRVRSKDREFARLTTFHGNQVAFVHPRDACGVGVELISGPHAEKTADATAVKAPANVGRASN